MKEDAAIHRADQHRALADARVVEMIAPVGICLGASHYGHAALQLDEQDIHALCGLIAIRAIVDDAGNRSCLGGRRHEHEQSNDAH